MRGTNMTMKLTNEQFVDLYYFLLEDNESKTLKQMKRKYPMLKENLQDIINRYDGMNFNNIMPFDKLNILRSRIRNVKKEYEFHGYCDYLMSYIENHKRVKARDALFLSLLIEYSIFHEEIKEYYKPLLIEDMEAMYLLRSAETGVDIKYGNISVDFSEMIDTIGGSLNNVMASDAEYRIRKLIEAVALAILNNQKFKLSAKNNEKIIRRGMNAILRETKTNRYTGIIDAFSRRLRGEKDLKALIDAGVDEVIFVAVIDEATTDICRSLNGDIIKVTKLVLGVNMPPIATTPHPCRSCVMTWEHFEKAARTYFRRTKIGNKRIDNFLKKQTWFVDNS